MTTQTHIESSFRELDYREADGLEIWLLWSPVTNAVTVMVHDAKTQDVREFSVEPEHASDAFRHPFAYLAELPEREPALNASPAA